MLEIGVTLPGTQHRIICGRNAKLAERLKALSADSPRFVEGFTQEVPYYMHLSDFFIGKPGPGSISEAVSIHLPGVLGRQPWALPQQPYYADLVRRPQRYLMPPH